MPKWAPLTTKLPLKPLLVWLSVKAPTPLAVLTARLPDPESGDVILTPTPVTSIPPPAAATVTPKLAGMEKLPVDLSVPPLSVS